MVYGYDKNTWYMYTIWIHGMCILDRNAWYMYTIRIHGMCIHDKNTWYMYTIWIHGMCMLDMNTWYMYTIRIRGICRHGMKTWYKYSWYEYGLCVYMKWIHGISILVMNTRCMYTWEEYVEYVRLRCICGICVFDMDLMRFLKYMNNVWCLTDVGYGIHVKPTTIVHGKWWLIPVMNMYMCNICSRDMHMWTMWNEYEYVKLYMEWCDYDTCGNTWYWCSWDMMTDVSMIWGSCITWLTIMRIWDMDRNIYDLFFLHTTLETVNCWF